VGGAEGEGECGAQHGARYHDPEIMTGAKTKTLN